MSWRDVRPVALAVVYRDDEVLLSEGSDPSTGERFYRPIGGSIEFGERSREAVVREFDEELGVELTGVELLGTLENVFTFDGQPGHEFVRVFEGRIVEDWPYERDSFSAYEPDHDEEFPVRWMHPSAIEDGDDPLYPEGLSALL